MKQVTLCAGAVRIDIRDCRVYSRGLLQDLGRHKLGQPLSAVPSLHSSLLHLMHGFGSLLKD